MKKTFAIKITSKHNAMRDFDVKGATIADVLDSVAVHLDRCSTSKQVMSITLEDGASRISTDYSERLLDQQRARIEAITKDMPESIKAGALIAALVAAGEDLSRIARDCVRLVAAGEQGDGVPFGHLAGACLTIQAIRERIDAIVDAEHPAKH